MLKNGDVERMGNICGRKINTIHEGIWKEGMVGCIKNEKRKGEGKILRIYM